MHGCAPMATGDSSRHVEFGGVVVPIDLMGSVTDLDSGDESDINEATSSRATAPCAAAYSGLASVKTNANSSVFVS